MGTWNWDAKRSASSRNDGQRCSRREGEVGTARIGTDVTLIDQRAPMATTHEPKVRPPRLWELDRYLCRAVDGLWADLGLMNRRVEAVGTHVRRELRPFAMDPVGDENARREARRAR